MWVLGLANSHNGAVALVKDGHVHVAIQLERLQRTKRFALEFGQGDIKTGVYKAINYCLGYAGISVESIDAIAACTPWPLRDEVFWPHGDIRWVPHHLAHAEYVPHYSKLEPGLVLIVDGHGTREQDRNRLHIREDVDPSAEIFAGEVETISAYRFDGANLSLVYRMCGDRNENDQLLNGSIGQVWELGSLICFGERDQAGKLMGLAGYGNGWHRQGILRLDGQGRLATQLHLLMDASLPYRDVAHAVQSETSRVLIELLGRLRGKTHMNNLYYSGGVALNVVSNESIIRSGLFEATHMNGSCEDNGTAIGAALAVYRDIEKRRVAEPITDCYGANYSRYSIVTQLKKHPVTFQEMTEAELTDMASEKLHEDRIIGWFQGRSEFGPRALGNRSILANPCSATAKDVLNGRVKHREPFRPYGSSVLLEKVSEYLDLEGDSPVMLRSARVTDPQLPAITHVDGASRGTNRFAARQPDIP